MKKLITVLVSFAMIFTLTAAVFAAPAEVTWEDYQQYLIDTAGSNAPDLQEFIDQVEAIDSWEDLDQSVSPWDMMFTTIGLSTWDEFQEGIVKEAAVPAGENMGGGSPEGESPEGESPEGESPEGESPEEQAAPEGESPAEEAPAAPEGESAEGESAGPENAATQEIGEVGPEGMKVSSFSTNNGDTGRPQDAGHIYVGYSIIDGELDADNSNWEGDPANIVLDESVEGAGFTAVRAEGDSVVNISGKLTLTDDTDGLCASDFTGTGVAITGYNGSSLYIDDMNFYSEGFARSFAIIQNANLFITDSDITTMGKDPLLESWDGYYNSAQTTMMISPPWVLGIQGGIRSVNVLGSGSSFVLADSSITSGGWAVVSTDGCQVPYLYFYNSALNILPASQGGMNSGWAILGYDENAYGSGYGTYFIGDAVENFYGASINGATYGAILRGGVGTYTGLKAGEVYEAVAEDGTVLGAYTAEEDIPTTINTVWGFMNHGDGTINVLEGTEINAAEGIVLCKEANTVWNFDGAQVNAGNGILFQMMDNDDSTVGGFNPFGTYLEETAGFPVDAYLDAVSYQFTKDAVPDPAKTYYIADVNAEGGYAVVDEPNDKDIIAYYEKSTGGGEVELNLANGEYDGDVYNGTGYYAQAADALRVSIADSAALNGDIALTSHVHGMWLFDRDVDEVLAAIDEANAYHANIGGYYEGLDDIEYVFMNAEGEITENKEEAIAIQFTKFSTAEYYLLGHVLNMVNYNGLSTIDVTVEGTWKPASVSLVTYLNVAEGAEVYGELYELEDGTILILPAEETIEPGEYGSAFVYVEGPGSSGESGGGESAEGESPAEEAPEGESPAEEAPAAPEGDSPEGESPEGESPAEEAPAAPEGEAPADAPAPPAEGEGPEALAELPAGDFVEAQTYSEMAGDITVYIYYENVDGKNVITDIIDKDGGFSIYNMVPDMGQFEELLEDALK
ncbi:MAG: hypothetical protein IJ106_05510 [Parasporobacterium sp.]|nr:hypothetical protein [Parasporobacterium sp.]